MKIYSGFYGDIANNISRGCVQEWGIYTWMGICDADIFGGSHSCTCCLTDDSGVIWVAGPDLVTNCWPRTPCRQGLKTCFWAATYKRDPKVLADTIFLSRFLKCENAWVAYCSGTHILLSTCHNSKSRSSSVAQVLVSTKQHSLGASAQWPVPLGVAPSLRMGWD